MRSFFILFAHAPPILTWTDGRPHLVSSFQAMQKIDTVHVKSGAIRGMSVKSSARSGWRMRAGQICKCLPTLLFTTGYACVLLWFYGVDVYHKHFSETGPLVLAHNFFRVLFIFYLFWMVHAAGTFLLQLVAKNLAGDGPLDRLALGFFAGTGVWHLALLVLGYFNLYTWTVAVAITLPVVALSYRNLRVGIDADQKSPRGGANWAAPALGMLPASMSRSS